MNSKFNSQLLQRSSFYSPINVLKKHKLSCLTLFTSKNTSLRFVTSTTTSRILTFTHNKTSLSNNSFLLPSYPSIFNNKRYFSNFFSLNFWSTKNAFKPRPSVPLNFFDLSTSTNKSTSNVPLTDLSSASTSTQNLSSPDPQTPSTPTPLPNPIIINPAATKRNKFILNHGGSGIPKLSENLISPSNDGNYHSIGCGEDSFFLRHDSIGVADGVGGWRNVASLHNSVADSALYSRKLMHYSYAELERYDNVDDEKYYHYNEVNPVDIMQASFEQSMKDCALKGVIGSSTVLLAILREDELRIANLGDCSIGVIRYNEYIFRNEEQQHSFNYPYQLGTGSLNTPQDSQKFTVKIQPGDIIVMGSDGIFDNLFEEDILEEIISCQRQNGLNPQIISDTLTWKAKIMSKDVNNCSPFQSRAIQEGLYYQGGKRDDISVLVAVVSDNRLDKDFYV